jgi:hypothetical protein
MHFGQIGFWQTWQRLVANWSGCFRHRSAASAAGITLALSDSADAGGAGACTFNGDPLVTAGADANGAARLMAGAGAAIRMGGRGFGAGGGAWTVATGASTVPNCCRMSSLTASELSKPQA